MVNKQLRKPLVIGITVIVALGVLVWFLLRPPAETPVVASPEIPAAPVVPPPSIEDTLESEIAVQEALETAWETLNTTDDPATVPTTMAALKEILREHPVTVTAPAIARYLENPEKDAPTGLPFAIGERGFLKSAPSLRVALLDWLGELDPELAAKLAPSILETPTHPDEWALAFRNLKSARSADPQHQKDIALKWSEMVAIDSWRNSPTAGFLASFEVLVGPGGTLMSNQLAKLAKDTTPESLAIARTALRTLHQLAMAAPQQTLASLNQGTQTAAERRQLIAQVVGRLDFSSPVEKGILQDYLLNTGRSSQELEAFAKSFPSTQYAVDRPMLSALDRKDLKKRDQVALTQMKAWSEDNKFSALRPWLKIAVKRLESSLEAPATK